MKPILVATDLSPRVEAAFDRALQLASQHVATVHLLFVMDDALPGNVAERLAREAEDMIRRKWFPRARDAGIEVTLVTRTGRAFEAILAEADAIEAELILLGTHRQEELRDLFTGSTAWRVLRGARRPVVQVKYPPTGPYRRVLAAVDFTPASREALLLACSLATDGKLSAVHAFTVPFIAFPPSHKARRKASDQARADMESNIAETLRTFTARDGDRPIVIHKEVHDGDVLAVVGRTCDLLRPDLLVIGTRGRVGLGEAFHKSIAEALLRRPPCDIAAVSAAKADAENVRRDPAALGRERG